MDSESFVMKVEKLSWSNFHMCKLKIESYLEAKDLFHFTTRAPLEDEDDKKNDKRQEQ